MKIGEWIREVETGTRLLPMRILNPEGQPEQIPVVIEPEVVPVEPETVSNDLTPTVGVKS